MDLVVDGLGGDGAALLALEEALVRACPSRPLLRLWVNPPAVVVGRFQDVAREVALAACVADGVAVLRRASGGGTVYHDLGNLNVTLVLPCRATHTEDQLATLLLSTLSGLRLPVERRQRGLFVGAAKLAGFASMQTGAGTLAHASLLVSTDAAAVGRYLTPVPATTSPRDSHRAPVASLRDHGVDIDIAQLAVTLCGRVAGLTRRWPSTAEWTAYEELLARRYRDPGWHLTGTTKERAWTTTPVWASTARWC